MKIGNVNSASMADISQRRNVSETPQVKDAVASEGVEIQGNQVSHAKQVQQDGQINDELLEKSVEQANKSLKKHDRYIERNVHEVTKAIMYKLKDTETNEVIAEFPPQKVQDMIAKMWELAGLFVDERG
jgi:uncharacterized FlaG/YvyC family protein